MMAADNAPIYPASRTRGTAAGGGFWLFDPGQSGSDVSKTIIKNSVLRIVPVCFC